jgi:hypothetical protein
MKNIMKNHYRLNSVTAIVIATSFILNIFAILIFEKSFNISLKFSNNIELNVGVGLLKVYKSININIQVIKITNDIFSLSAYKDVLVDKKLIKFILLFMIFMLVLLRVIPFSKICKNIMRCIQKPSFIFIKVVFFVYM